MTTKVPETIWPENCQPTDAVAKVIAGLNPHDPQDMYVIKPMLEKYVAVVAERDHLLASIPAIVLDAQLRALERGRLDTPDKLRALAKQEPKE